MAIREENDVLDLISGLRHLNAGFSQRGINIGVASDTNHGNGLENGVAILDGRLGIDVPLVVEVEHQYAEVIREVEEVDWSLCRFPGQLDFLLLCHAAGTVQHDNHADGRTFSIGFKCDGQKGFDWSPGVATLAIRMLAAGKYKSATKVPDIGCHRLHL